MWTEGRVIERIDWNSKLFSLRIAAEIAPFIAGQFIKLSQVRDDKRIARAYSLVNAPGTDYLEILAVAVDQGQLSPDLQSLQPGDSISVTDKATGFMTLDEIPKGELQGRHLWFLATGTAVGPFLSMLDTQEPWQRFDKVVLVYGVREVQDLAYLDKIRGYQQTYHEQFVFVPSVTREDFDGALRCRIPDGLQSGEIEAKAGLSISAKDSQLMLCGNPGMIQGATAVLIDKGLAKNLRRAPGQITVEKYW
ncbi:ferredoxin--NADP reductase [Shewanella algae]|uniref:ferredoxin--NADP reductase n=1 Tax=Shewanella algae TaxID=38313 RepID=UPI000D128829|nr:ferredoxin--NADP reductase [Shewanella algae]PSS67540.1 ferredoxin--NADP(+) reductase [Shewanella algae]TVL02337.1 ferredoxin--NADP(+) reductase [Shewanella algae]TVL09361.1 ferredoxin--NADP(+) reductase [Shewanella algae]TVL46164.1 ferredoxin--NADP(+) reductase [Shewanella algae]